VSETISVSTEGTEEIDRQLARLEVEVREKALGRAMTRAAARGRKLTRDATPRNQGTGGDPQFPDLRKEIKSKVVHRGERWTAIVGASVQARHAHLVEFGHRMIVGGTIASGGRMIGFVEPHAFVRPSFEQFQPESEQILLEELRTVVDVFAG